MDIWHFITKVYISDAGIYQYMGLIPFFIYLTKKYLFYLYFIQCYSLDYYYLRITKTSFRFASKFLSKIIVFNISSQYYLKNFSRWAGYSSQLSPHKIKKHCWNDTKNWDFCMKKASKCRFWCLLHSTSFLK